MASLETRRGARKGPRFRLVFRLHGRKYQQVLTASTEAEAEQEARFALRAYHLQGEFVPAPGTAAEALASAALLWGSALTIVPAPARTGLFNDYSALNAALAAANTNVLVVP